MSDFFTTYKKTIVRTMIGIVIPAVFTVLWFATLAYADGRYVGIETFERAERTSEVRDLHMEMKRFDHEVFKATQQGLWAVTDQQKAVAQSLVDYFEAEKEAVQRTLNELNTPKDG